MLPESGHSWGEGVKAGALCRARAAATGAGMGWFCRCHFHCPPAWGGSDRVLAERRAQRDCGWGGALCGSGLAVPHLTHSQCGGQAPCDPQCTFEEGEEGDATHVCEATQLVISGARTPIWVPRLLCTRPGGHRETDQACTPPGTPARPLVSPASSPSPWQRALGGGGERVYVGGEGVCGSVTARPGCGPRGQTCSKPGPTVLRGTAGDP